MLKRRLFNKKKNHYLILFFIIFLILFFVLLSNYKNNINFFEISEFKGLFYIIPENKGGIKVENLDKKALHL